MVEDRSKRYANPPKAPKRNGGAPNPEEGEAKRKAEATAGSGMPTDQHPGPVGKVGEDPGPEGGHDATWGVVADRHKQEHGDMLKRHHADHLAHSEARHAMVSRHGEEAKKMHARHQEEMANAMEGEATQEAERTAGSPPKLGETKSEGTKGAEA